MSKKEKKPTAPAAEEVKEAQEPVTAPAEPQARRETLEPEDAVMK